jgi:Helix-turn-helix domain
VVSALEWAEIRTLAKDGVSQREIARRLGINRRTVVRALAVEAPPQYVRATAGSQLDPLMGVIGEVLEQWPDIKAPRLTELLRVEHGYEGSVDLVRRRLAGLRPREERPAQRTGYRPGQVVQFDWGEMPTRPRILGVERRVYALVASLPFSGAQTAHFSFDNDVGVVLGGARPGVRLAGWGASRMRLRQPEIGGRQARLPAGGALEPTVPSPSWPLCVSFDGVHPGDAAGEGLGRGRGALPEERLLARPPVSDPA